MADHERPGRVWWFVAALFVAGLVVALVFGLLILPTSIGSLTFGMDASVRSDLAAGLLGGAVIGMAVLGAEITFGRQLAETERQRTVSAERDSHGHTDADGGPGGCCVLGQRGGYNHHHASDDDHSTDDNHLDSSWCRRPPHCLLRAISGS